VGPVIPCKKGYMTTRTTAPHRPPNIVLIICDQQGRRQVGCYGNPAAQTPAIDALAADGIRFDNGYTYTPVCTPARAALFTGKTPEQAGAWANGLPLYEHVTTLHEHFQKHGYRSGYTGKWHLDGEGGYWGSGQPARGCEPNWWYDGRNYLDDLGPEEARAYTQTNTIAKLRERNLPDDYCWGYRVANRAMAFLDDVPDDQPFILTASFDEPHPPLVCPARFLDQHDPATLPLPDSRHETLEDKPVLQQLWARNCRDKWNMTDETLREGIHHWYACNSFIDAQIGRLMAHLDRNPDRARHTIVVLTSDHGDFYGAHGLLGKGPALYDEIAAVPFIMRAPGYGSPGTANPALVSHIDVFPTLADMAGIPIPGELAGSSFKAALSDPTCGAETLLVSFTRFDHKGGNLGGFYPVRAIRDARYKLILNLLDRDEFYDLQEDPGECRNLIEATATASERNRLHDRLLQRLVETYDLTAGYGFHHRPWRQNTRFPLTGP